jgi:hypothetical protein
VVFLSVSAVEGVEVPREPCLWRSRWVQVSACSSSTSGAVCCATEVPLGQTSASTNRCGHAGGVNSTPDRVLSAN